MSDILSLNQARKSKARPTPSFSMFFSPVCTRLQKNLKRALLVWLPNPEWESANFFSAPTIHSFQLHTSLHRNQFGLEVHRAGPRCVVPPILFISLLLSTWFFLSLSLSLFQGVVCIVVPVSGHRQQSLQNVEGGHTWALATFDLHTSEMVGPANSALNS
jgi:hypothetical protein